MIHLLTASSPKYAELTEITAPTKVRYASKWGYNFCRRRHSRNFSQIGFRWWERMQFILDLFEQQAETGDWVWFTGADLAIVNSEINLQEILFKGLPFSTNLIVGEDRHTINNDSMFYKYCDPVIEFLEKTIQRYSYGDSCDQTAQWNILMDHSVEGISLCYAPLKLFNSHWVPNVGDNHPTAYRPGDFVLHLPGMSNDSRIKLFKTILELDAK